MAPTDGGGWENQSETIQHLGSIYNNKKQSGQSDKIFGGWKKYFAKDGQPNNQDLGKR